MHLEHVALIVDDYDDAIRFFVDILGFELVEDSPALTSRAGRPKRWVVVGPPGAITGLLLARADGDREVRAIGDQFAGRVGLFLRVEDFQSSYERMRAAGVEFGRLASRRAIRACRGVSRRRRQSLGLARTPGGGLKPAP